MKKMLGCFVLIGLVVVAACKNESPSPSPVPTPASVTWSVTGLTASSTTPEVYETIVFTATVTMDGGAAPDGTIVEFIASGCDVDTSTVGDELCYFPDTVSLLLAEVETQNGSASIRFYAVSHGTYTVQARVVDSIRQLSVTYEQPDESTALQIYSINPEVGPLSGGQMAFITGKNISPPVDVFFLLSNGNRYHAVTLEVGTAGDSLTITTPTINDVDQALEWTADVEVNSRVGVYTGDDYVDTLPAAYRFSRAINEPVIYTVVPDHGSSRGGETISIIGQNFIPRVQVKLTCDGGLELEGGQETVSPDGQLISFLTPQASVTPLSNVLCCDVVVQTQDGTDHEREVSKTDAFCFDADVRLPYVTSIDPPAGPFDGGTVVSLYGRSDGNYGFELPGPGNHGVQVSFGTRFATVNDVAVDKIVCLSPDMSTVEATPPYSVDVVVTNLSSGLASEPVTYTYGEELYISGIQPNEGGRGTLVTIYGSGFEDPLVADFSDIRLETIAVSGTEVIVRFPDDAPGKCAEASGAITLTMLDTGQSVSSPTFIYLSETPIIYSVAPPIVTETLGGFSTTPNTITIYGANFSDTVLVRIGAYILTQNEITVVDEGTITVLPIPTPAEMGLTFDEIPCTTTTGLPGTRFAPTTVEVTVTNLPADCLSSEVSNLTYEPQDATCTERADIDITPADLVYPDTPAGSCSSLTTTIMNIGSAPLTISNILVTSPYVLVAPIPPTFTLAGSGSMMVTIDFCPTAEGGLTYNGQATVLSDDPNEPITYITLTGTELQAPEISTSPYITGDTWTIPNTITVGSCSPTEVLTISNSGDGPSSLSASVTGPFEIVTAPAATLPTGQNTTLELRYCATAVGGQTGTLTIDCDDPVNCPVTIGLAGTGG